MASPTPALALLACLAMLTPAAASPLEPLVRTPSVGPTLDLFASEEFLDAARDYIETFSLDDLPGQAERTASFVEDLLNQAPGLACIVGFSGRPVTQGVSPPGNWSIPGTLVNIQTGRDASIAVFGVGPVMTRADIPIPGIGYWKIASSDTGREDCIPLTGLMVPEVLWIRAS